MPNDNRDWTNGRFMNADLKRSPPPTDKEIIDALAAALEACIQEINDSAREIAENGGVMFDDDTEWQEGSAVAMALSALALARGESGGE